MLLNDKGIGCPEDTLLAQTDESPPSAYDNARLSQQCQTIGSATTIAKTCVRCRMSKAVSDFHKKGHRLDARCKQCVSISKKKRYSRRKKIAERSFKSLVNVEAMEITIEGLDQDQLTEAMIAAVSR